MPTLAYVPAKTPTISGLTLITDRVFSRKYVLVPRHPSTPLAPGAKAGIIVGAIAGAALLAAVLVLARRRNQNRLDEQSLNDDFETTEMEGRTRGLASSQAHPRSPRSAGSGWPLRRSVSPPNYDDGRDIPTSAKVISPQELQGNTFMHENHPAFQSSNQSESVDRQNPSPHTSPQRTPLRSPVHTIPRSPPASPPISHNEVEGSPVISPSHSPKLGP